MRGAAVLKDFMDMLFPAHCLFCGSVIFPEQEICDSCAVQIPSSDLCFPMRFPQNLEEVLCCMPFEYAGKVRKSILDFKFYGHTEYADFYARRIGELLIRHNIADKINCITAVPISEKRKKSRGYNQSELIGRTLSKYLNIPYEELLIKIKENKTQHELPETERKQNVKGVYAAINKQKIEGRSILLIDDIMTTGATMGECCKVLYDSDAEGLFCAAIARVL